MSRLFSYRTAILVFLLSGLMITKLYSDDSMRVGEKSILFQLSKDNLFPDGFMGGVGYQFYISKNAALRIPVGFGYSSELEEKPDNTEADKESESWSLRLTPGIRYNLGKGEKVNIYTGAQLMFEYGSSTISGKDFKSNEELSSIYRWGIGAMLGAEWFPWKSLSFGLEYSPFLKFSGGSTDYNSGGFSQTDKLPSETSFDTNMSSILLIVSFWFN